MQRCSDAAEQILVLSAEQTAGGKERKKEEREKNVLRGIRVLQTAGVSIESDPIAKINVLHISILL